MSATIDMDGALSNCGNLVENLWNTFGKALDNLWKTCGIYPSCANFLIKQRVERQEPLEVDMRKRLQFMLFTTIAICLLITAGESKARAQISGEIEADIPFPFYAGNAGFEAGKYTIRPV